MNKLEELRKQWQQLTSDADAIAQAARAKGVELEAGDSERINELMDQADAVQAQIDDLEAQQAAATQATDRIAAHRERMATPRPRVSAPADVLEVENTTGVPTIAQPDDGRMGFATPRDFLMAVFDHAQGRSDQRLDRLAAVGSDEARTGSDPAGGFLVPESFVSTPLMLQPEVDPIQALVTSVPMAAPTVHIPARVDKDHRNSVSGGFRVYRREETGTTKDSQLKFERVTLHAESLAGLGYATQEMIDDSPTSFVSLLEQAAGEEFAAKRMDERLNGDGKGKYLGVLNAPCTIAVDKEDSQPAATITAANVINMRSRCYRYGQAVWLYNHDTLPQLMTMKIEDTSGNAVSVWQGRLTEDRPDLLLGRPAYATEFCQTLGAKGDIVLGNWGHYLQGEYQPMRSASSIHVRFVQHEQAFRFDLRDAGQPWWKTTLRTKYSAQTLSPFVVLAERA